MTTFNDSQSPDFNTHLIVGDKGDDGFMYVTIVDNEGGATILLNKTQADKVAAGIRKAARA